VMNHRLFTSREISRPNGLLWAVSKFVVDFAALFSSIDDQRDSLSISGYGISMTTLEEVFLKLGEGCWYRFLCVEVEGI